MRGGEHTKGGGEGKRIVGAGGENRVPDLADGGRGRDAVARWRATVTGLHSTCGVLLAAPGDSLPWRAI